MYVLHANLWNELHFKEYVLYYSCSQCSTHQNHNNKIIGSLFFIFSRESMKRTWQRWHHHKKKCFPKQKCCSWNKTIKKEFLIQKNCLNQKYYWFGTHTIKKKKLKIFKIECHTISHKKWFWGPRLQAYFFTRMQYCDAYTTNQTPVLSLPFHIFPAASKIPAKSRLTIGHRA